MTLSLKYIAVYSSDFQTLVSLDRLASSFTVFIPLAFNRNLETNFVHPTSISKIAEQFSIHRSCAWRGLSALVGCKLFTPAKQCKKGEIRGTLNLSKGGESKMNEQYVKLSQQDMAKIMNARNLQSTLRVFRVIAYQMADDNGIIRWRSMQTLADKARISYKSAWNGYRSLVEAKLLEPDPLGKPVSGRLLLSCWAKRSPEAWIPKPREMETIAGSGNFQSAADILKQLKEGKGIRV